jgi:hypothetical protein
MPSTDTKPELTAKASMAQPVSQPAVYANGLKLETGLLYVISGFRCEEDENLAVLGYYSAGIGSLFPTFRDKTKNWDS